MTRTDDRSGKTVLPSGLTLLVVGPDAPATALRHASLRADPRVASIALCHDLESALSAARSTRVAVALVDLALGNGAGADLVATLGRRSPPVPSVVLAFGDRRRLLDAVAAGARACLLPEEPPDRIVGALVAARSGVALSTLISPDLLAEPGSKPKRASVQLPPREREVLRLLARGCTYDDCSRALGVKIGTVQGYVKSLYRRLDVCTKAEAITVAMQLGWLDDR